MKRLGASLAAASAYLVGASIICVFVIAAIVFAVILAIPLLGVAILDAARQRQRSEVLELDDEIWGECPNVVALPRRRA